MAWTHGQLGYGVIKKTAGAATPTIGTQTSFPVGRIVPVNPANVTFPPLVNANASLSVSIQDKRTPSIQLLRCPAKPSWCLSPLLNSLIVGLDANNNTDEYGVGANDGNATRVYDGCKMRSLSIYQMPANSGSVLVDMDWLAQYGDTESGSPTSFSAVTSDAGLGWTLTDQTFNSTASDVTAWRLNMQRGQASPMAADGTIYGETLQSGFLSGTLTLTQNALAATVPTTTATIKLGTTGAGIQIVAQLQLLEKREEVAVGMVTATRTYALFSSAGTIPVAITAL